MKRSTFDKINHPTPLKTAADNVSYGGVLPAAANRYISKDVNGGFETARSRKTASM